MDKDDKLWAGLSYVGLILCAVPTIIILFLKKESEVIKFHSIQAIGLCLVGFILSVLYLVPFMGLILWIPQLALFGYWIYLTVKVFMGEDEEVPILGDFIRSNLM